MDNTDTLLKIKNSLEIFKSAINDSVNTKSYITNINTIEKNTNINIIETNIINNYNNLLNDKFLIYLTQDIEKIICQIDTQLLVTCEHELITDYTDVFPERSLAIKYCTKCNLTI